MWITDENPRCGKASTGVLRYYHNMVSTSNLNSNHSMVCGFSILNLRLLLIYKQGSEIHSIYNEINSLTAMVS
jgi:hypothetical protein